MNARRIVLLVSAIALLSATLTGCQTPAPTAAPEPTAVPAAPTAVPAEPTAKPAEPAEPTAAPATGLDLKVAVVLPGLINDGGFNQTGYEAAMQAQEDLGVEVNYVESIATPDAPKILRDYAIQGYDVVFGYSGSFSNAVIQVAPDFPDTTFVAIAPSDVEFPPNVWVIGHDYMDGFFLAGAMAGLMTKTNKVSFIGGVEIPSYKASSIAYGEGAELTNPDVEVSTTFVGDFNDPVGAKQAALAHIENGVDIIQSAVDNGVFGLFEAARESENVRVIHYVKDLCDQAPDVIMASLILDYPGYVQYILKKVAAGEKGGYVSNSVTKGSNKLLPCGDQVPTDVQAQVDEVLAKMNAGEIKWFHVLDLQ